MSSLGAYRKPLVKIKDETLYYPHQAEGIRTMARMSSFLLADEMGLGKSLQSLTVAAIDWELGFASRGIIVAPASLKWNWEAEIAEHTNFSCMVLNGTPKEREMQLEEFRNNGCDWLIVNYEQVTAHLAELNKLRFDIAIFDEAHYLKNPKAKRTKASLDLVAPRSFVLTGSPVLNRVDELWALLHRIDKDSFPTYWKFVNRYAVWGGYKDKEIVGLKHKEELNEIIANYMIRRLKADVLDLPDKQYIKVLVDLHPEQAKLYKQATDELKLVLPDSPDPMELENAMTRMLRLKQICGTTATLTDDDHSYKLDAATEKAIELIGNGHPVVTFSQFRKVQSAFLYRLDGAGIRTFYLNGDTPPEDRVPTVQAWAECGEPAVIVCASQVAGVGLNMTHARHEFFLDKLYVPKLNEQCADRCHRIGADLTQPVQIYEFICRNTVEQRIEQILRKKEKLFDTLIEDSDWKRALYDAMKEEGII